MVETGRQLTLRLTSTHAEAARAGLVDGPESVPERTTERCGAVECGVLGAGLGEDLGAVAAAPGRAAGTERVKRTAAESGDIPTGARRVE